MTVTGTEHGGDVAGYELAYGRKPVDFSASLNPFGMPEGVRRAARRAVDDAAAYPDPECGRLRRGLAEDLGVKAEWILCGNGAADVLFRIMLGARPARGLVTAPAFSEYENALVCAGAEVLFHPLSRVNDFLLDDGILAALAPDVDVVCLCQPNNPTGQTIRRDLLAAILSRCEENGTLLVMDECFVPFVDADQDVSILSRVRDFSRLVVVGSFTKLYAMAGLRLGFAVSSDAAFLDRMRRAGQPWSVSSIAQAAGCAALGERAYVEESLAALRVEREWLVRQFAGMGIHCLGEANYLFFSCGRKNLHQALAEKGILIRDCGNFRGLRAGDYRIAVRGRGDNEKLIAAVKTFLEAPGWDGE